MVEGLVPEGIPTPDTAAEMAEQLQREVVGAMEKEGFRHLTVFLFRGNTWEKWLLGEGLPTAADDMVRWICGRLGDADTVGTAEAVLGQVDGKAERLIRIVAEKDGKRAERVVVMTPKPGLPDDVMPGRTMVRELGTVAEGDGWIGVKPMVPGELIGTAIGYGTPQ